MKIVFFGSSVYSTIVETSLIKSFDLSLVVTLPDRILGRKKVLTSNPVKKAAQQYNIPVLTTEKLTEEVIEKIKRYQPDFLVVTDYGLILPKTLLDVAKYAPLNVHHSLLPKYRGPTPVPSAILAGEKETGVSVIKMTEEVDAGDILAQKKFALDSTQTTLTALTSLNTLGAELVIKVINNYTEIKPIPQDNSLATFTPHMNKNDGFVDISNYPLNPTPYPLERMVRAYYPWPGVWTLLPRHSDPGLDPGEESQLRVKLLPNNLLQPEGKKPMNIKDFINGYPEAKPVIEDLFSSVVDW